MAVKLAIILMTGLSLAVAALGLHAGMAPGPVTARIQWVHYIDLGLPEQDVFVESGNARAATPDPYFIAHLLGLPANDGPNVIRVEGQSARTPANLARQVYAATRIVPHDPFKLDPNPLGPYYKGDPLGLTLAEWLAARGSGTYTVSGAEAELRLDFQQLVPGGHYALWCGRTSGPPAYSEADKACGAADGSQNQFKADAQGNAIFHLHLKALPASTHTFASVLMLTYERDVDSSDGGWGGYGLSSHVQLFYAFPLSPNAAIICGGQSRC